MERSVLLIGAGHSHIEVVRHWAEEAIEGTRLMVIDPNPKPIYSGMVPGYIAGQYRRQELEIDLRQLCSRARVEYLQESALSIDPGHDTATCSSGRTVGYDVVSIDIGSSVAGMDLEGVAEYALPSRPIEPFLRRIDELVSKVDSADAPPILVVGAGAGGVEVAFCLDARVKRTTGPSSHSQIQIVSPNAELLEGGARSARRAIERQATRRGIVVHRHRKVCAVSEHGVEFDDGESLRASGVVWVTGPAAIPAARGFDLPKDDRGFFEIDSSFRVRDTANVFAVGDCASLEGMKKAGVYAVRAGPILDANLRAHLSGAPLREYQPQRDFLSLLNLGNGEALGTKWGLSFRGRIMMRLKDRIDRAFMEKYR